MIPNPDRRRRANALYDRVSRHIAGADALLLPSLIGLVAGIVTGLGMVLFRLVIDHSQELLLGADNLEGYESLSPMARMLLPLGGGIVVGILFQNLARPTRQIGVAHVIERLSFHEGYLPIRNAIAQFIGASISLISGHSGGREGPAIHVGAASATFIGDRLHLPNNARRVLIGCGTAAAIAASFDTPLAGVIFAMEVVLMEYTLTGFTPIVLASVSGTLVSRMFFPSAPIFSLSDLDIGHGDDILPLLVTGVSIGILAAIMVRLLGFVAARTKDYPPLPKFAAAGLLTGMVAVVVPQVMGIGYDTVDGALTGEFAISTLVVVASCKLLVTSVGLGLGIPAGVIGPSLIVGATAGMALGIGYVQAGWVEPSGMGTFVLVGMGAMMSSVLHAPLAALTAILELTGQHRIVFPGMLVIVSAYLTSRSLLRTDSVFTVILRARGIAARNDPMSQSLSRLGVARAMSSEFAELAAAVSRETLTETLRERPRWLILETDEGNRRLVAAAELAALLDSDDSEELDLESAPLRRRAAANVGFRSTLAEAQRRMEEQGIDALFVTERREGGDVIGVLTREDMERAYRVT